MRTTPRRRAVIGRVLIACLIVPLLAACATQATVTSTPSASMSASSAPDDPAARDAFGEAICPLFTRIVALDPRLGAIRESGGGGGDMTANEAELASLADELLSILDDLAAVPAWGPGQRLQYELVTGIHRIRTQLLVATEDLSDPGAAEALAAIPYLASRSMDRAMGRASAGGLTCGDGS